MGKRKQKDFLSDIPAGQILDAFQMRFLIYRIFPSYSSHSRSWVLKHLCQEGYFQRVGRGRFVKGVALPTYLPEKSVNGKKIVHLLKDQFKEADICLYDSTNLNKYLKTPLIGNTTFVFVESSFKRGVFKALQSGLKVPVLFHPKSSEFDLYWTPDCVVVEPLVSKAPLGKKAFSISLEKLIVDFVCGDSLAYAVPLSAFEEALPKLALEYQIDLDRLLTYAKRRHAEEKTRIELKNALPEEYLKTRGFEG